MFKSIKTGVLALLLLSTAVLAQAQKAINEGTVNYAVVYELTPEQKTSMDASVLPTETALEFNGDLSSIKMDLGAAMVNVISDANTKKALLLIDVPMAQKQFATKMSAEDVAKQKGNTKYANFKATGEKQTIAGYKAEKYTYNDDKGANLELWLTKDIKLAKGAVHEEFAALNGTPLIFTLFGNGIKSIYTLKSIKENKVGPFSMDVPKGYEEKTMAEMEAMQGGGE
jgi:GLPGLI family protein